MLQYIKHATVVMEIRKPKSNDFLFHPVDSLNPIFSLCKLLNTVSGYPCNGIQSLYISNIKAPDYFGYKKYLYYSTLKV